MSTPQSKGCLFLASSLCDGVEDNNIKQVTTLLLNNEANPNTLIPTYGVTPFHLVIGNDSEAFAEEVTKLFLRHGGNPNVKSADGLTPVHVAAAWGRVTVLELLLANGGDPLCLDDEGRSPFHYAFDGKYYKVIVVLGKYCDNIAKEEKMTNHKMTFDKLIINNGGIIAEYVAVQQPDMIRKNDINENRFDEHKENKFPYFRDQYAFNFNDDQSDINAAELRIKEEIDKEKYLVNEIINRLSSSLKYKDQEINKDHGQSNKHQYDTSPRSSLNTDDSMASMMNKFSLRTKRKHVTPRYKRRIFGQNNKIPLIPVYNPNDSIISKSPNLVIGNSIETEQKYLSPRVLNRETKFKSFTPCMTRNGSFRSEEFNLGTDMARSTPRRRRRFCKQFSFSWKSKKSNENTSSENTSPDSMNSISPDRSYPRKLNYKNVAIKLDENKYDDDVPINLCSNENKNYIEKYGGNKINIVEGLNKNIENLGIRKVDRIVKHERNLKPKNKLQTNVPEETKINNASNAFRENFNTFLSSFKSQSYITVQEEYKYEDTDEGLAFLERRIYTIPPWKSRDDCSSVDQLWPQLLNLSIDNSMTNETLRRNLISLGDNPGPVTSSTRQIYLKRLVKLQNEPRASPSCSFVRFGNFSTSNSEFQMEPFLIYGDWVNNLGTYKIIEQNTFKEFTSFDPSRKWREGTKKTCFNYLLLDPRITKDLPSRANELAKPILWSKFLSAVFYIGKGTGNRPYSHLKDAFDAWVNNYHPQNSKTKQILEIWNARFGVVCLHIFQSSIPVAAYTREAAMIDAFGKQHLKNCKPGDYYGIAKTWNTEEKRCFGRYLLYKAMQIFLLDGERQIFPQDF